MEIIVFETESYKKLQNEQIEAVRAAFVEALKEIKSPDQDWIPALEAHKLLGYRSKTKLQQLRDSGEVIFSQHGRTIMYSRKSIIAFLERNVK